MKGKVGEVKVKGAKERKKDFVVGSAVGGGIGCGGGDGGCGVGVLFRRWG